MNEPEIIRLRSADEFRRELAEDVRRGLTAEPKALPSKYFYDERGSLLFERITRLPEYYLTRAETSILERSCPDLIAAAGPSELVEIGGGMSRKTELLLSPLAAGNGTRYVSLDVSEDALGAAASRLSERFPTTRFSGFVGDFERDLLEIPRSGRRMVAFLGSTIGNLDRGRRGRFLRMIRAMLQDGDSFLLGVDLVKPVERLEAAYDDEARVTAAFNRNVLQVLNRELSGNLPVEDFRHRAFFDRDEEWIEMRLVAGRVIHARLEALELAVEFAEREEMRTEISCKFRRDRLTAELEGASLTVDRWLTDENGDFALVLCSPGARTNGS